MGNILTEAVSVAAGAVYGAVKYVVVAVANFATLGIFKLSAYDKDALEKEMNCAVKIIYEVSDDKRVAEDNKDISEMVSAAKQGNFQRSLQILRRKPNLVNAIPANRAWSVLHQAVYFDNESVIKELLGIPNCDINIKAKQDHAGEGVPGITPIKLAEKRKASCLALLRRNRRNRLEADEITFIPLNHYSNSIVPDGTIYSYLYLSVAFLKEEIIRNMELNNCTFAGMCKQMYDLLHANRSYVQQAIASCVRPLDVPIAEEITQTTSVRQLKETLVKIYTQETFFRKVNAALRRAAAVVQRKLSGQSYDQSPKGDDLLVAMYALFLQAVLLYWEELPKATQTTYRGVSLTAQQAAMYRVGSVFCWLPFSSSSQNRQQAVHFCRNGSGERKVLFKVNNDMESIWSPRDIAAMSEYQYEEEVLHPCGTKFVVNWIHQMDGYEQYDIELVRHVEA